ncbi:mycofactocin precursor MftA [Allosalinactinospora lopnorensis]|nr:mycofactocin precursor MftA [Allosalinactinospora lopnorensis]
MSDHPSTPTTETEPHTEGVPPEEGDTVAEVLVEEVSIDGMCGVY